MKTALSQKPQVQSDLEEVSPRHKQPTGDYKMGFCCFLILRVGVGNTTKRKGKWARVRVSSLHISIFYFRGTVFLNVRR